MKASLKNNFITNENLNDELFYSTLAEELEQLMEEELSKSYEDINPEIIDDCCAALTSIYDIQNGEAEAPQNLTVINSVIKKYNLRQRKKAVMAAACAAVAILSVGAATLSLDGNIVAEGSLIKSALGKFETLFTIDVPSTEAPTTETTTVITAETTEPSLETTTEPEALAHFIPPTATQVAEELKSIAVLPPPGFNSTFTSRESISLKNFYVSLTYTTGRKETIPISKATYKICEAQPDGTTEIKVNFKDMSSSIYVTVLPEEELKPIVLNSIYGTFETGYHIEEMRVFAVYSDTTEKEIPVSLCTVTTQEFPDGESVETIVTVEYEGCSFQFLCE